MRANSVSSKMIGSAQQTLTSFSEFPGNCHRLPVLLSVLNLNAEEKNYFTFNKKNDLSPFTKYNRKRRTTLKKVVCKKTSGLCIVQACRSRYICNLYLFHRCFPR